MKKRLITAVVATMLCAATTVHAQRVVIDPTNLVQNTLTAIRTVEQTINHIHPPPNAARFLTHTPRTLACLPYH